MKKITFLEGLPGVGKSTLAKILKDSYGVLVSEEIEKKEIYNNINGNQLLYIENDEIKINKYTDGNIVIDRGLISTLAYNITRKILNENHEIGYIVDWFLKNKDIYSKEYVKVIYLKREGFKIPYDDVNDPYGSEYNQRLLEEIALTLCRKYVKNLKIIHYDYKKDMEVIINEIIN